MQRIKELEQVATALVGDGKSPNLFFVTHKGACIHISRSGDSAYRVWQDLPRNTESTLEDRKVGTLCSTEPDERGKLRTYDDYAMYHAARRTH